MKNHLILPDIIKEHFILRTIMKKDYLDMYDYASDYRVVSFLSWGPHKNNKESKRVIKSFLSRPQKGLPIGYAIVDRKSSKMIGTIDYHTKINPFIVEIGYVLNSNYWNQGIMSSALKEVIKVGFEILKYDKLIIKHAKTNMASQRVIEKSGFVYTKTIENGFYNRFLNTFEDVIEYEFNKEMYYDK